MKVLVTGGAGYIGAHTVKALINAGHQVIIFDNLSSGINDDLGAHVVKGDITIKEDLEKLGKATSFDALMHFAAKIEVKESQENPGLYYQNNVLGAINLLEIARAHKVKTIVFSSTAAVYGNSESMPLVENSSLQPESVYGKTKLIIEQMLQDYHRAYGLKVVIFRYFNAAGASTDASIGENHQPETHLIPLLITKMLKKEPIIINGKDFPTPDGTPIRDFIHVLDIAKAHVLGLEYAEFEDLYEIFNLGTGKGYSVLEVVKKLEQIVGVEIAIEYGQRRQGDPTTLIASADKAKKLLGWQPEYSSLDTILQTALHWHKKRMER